MVPLNVTLAVAPPLPSPEPLSRLVSSDVTTQSVTVTADRRSAAGALVLAASAEAEHLEHTDAIHVRRRTSGRRWLAVGSERTVVIRALRAIAGLLLQTKDDVRRCRRRSMASDR
jgi:hypothetical protein